ncbi:4Fe-4S dicluster domain-containing protein [Spirochaetota bacterium]
MSSNNKKDISRPKEMLTRKELLLKGGAVGITSILASVGCRKDSSFFESLLQKHFKEMTREELKRVLDRLENEYYEKYKKKFTLKATNPIPNTLFGYGLDIAKCIGCRRCVYACVKENNQSHNPQVHWITVLRFKKGDKFLDDMELGTKYYDPKKVPQKNYFYMPVQCQQCRNAPCVKVCPSKATWQEEDGITVVDYNYCIGCRFCMAACPYGARHMNWGEPHIPGKDINTKIEYLGNRPRHRGCVEKCTFCIQRVRNGFYPACVEVCPVGARKFGNLLDPKSEIRNLIENKRVFRLKDGLNTEPKFYYFFTE